MHTKSHGVFDGRLPADDDPPAELARGTFATPGEHRVYLRMAANVGDLLPEAISAPRGVAMKICDVVGERLPNAVCNAQDFIMINAPVPQVPNAEQFLGDLGLPARTTDRIEGTEIVASKTLQSVNTSLERIGIDSVAIKTMGGAPNVTPPGEIYDSATAFRWGDDMANFSLRSISEDLIGTKAGGTRSAKKFGRR